MTVVDEREIIFSALTQMLEFILQSYFLSVHFRLEKKNVITIENCLSWKCGFHCR
jgi:hypothetical protein